MSKVIKFPGDKARKNKESDFSENIYYGLERKKVLVSASIVSLLVVVALFNFTLKVYQNEQNPGARSIASVGDVVRNKKVIEQEKVVLNRLIKSPMRNIASIGGKPSSFEKTLFGTFGANYKISYDDNNLLKELTFKNDGTGDPALLQERKSFLEEHYMFFLNTKRKPNVVFSKKMKNSGQHYESFFLKDSDKEGAVVEVTFHLDSQGRVLSLNSIKKN